MKILLVNSDLAKNRGDRAIAEGIIALVRHHLPGATITGVSEQAERDTQWFGIRFLPMDALSLNPLDWIRLLVEARRSDLVLWGGGELLKDYTNKAALWYWAVKVALLRIVNRNIVGVYQGIGPTYSERSRRSIAWTVGRTRLFIAREAESAQRLRDWGADVPIHASSDPAVIPPASPESADADTFFDDFVAIGPRRWFHYERGGLLPFRYRRKSPGEEYTRYVTSLVSIIDTEIGAGRNVLLVPMHMGAGEGDVSLCAELRGACKDPGRVRILDSDDVSPSALRGIISRARHFVGIRLHSTILALSAGVPAITYYYVDKGRQFFDQVGMNDFARPIETMLEPDFADRHRELVGRLEEEHSTVSRVLTERIDALRDDVMTSFRRVYDTNTTD